MKQAAHIRKYQNGKKVVVNPNIKKRKAPSKPKDKSAELMTAAILFPVIAFQGYEEDFPKMLRENIPTMRLMQVMKAPKDFINYATDEEALGYLSTMSLKAPLKTNAKNVFTHLFNKVMPKEKHELTKPLNREEQEYVKEIKSYIRRKQWQKYREAKE